MRADFQERLNAAMQGTHALIDLDAFAGNVTAMLRLLPSGPDAELMAVVKANAYGHGAIMIARTAIEAGARRLGVARIEEGLLLRRHGITAPILALGPFNAALLSRAADHGIAISIGSTGGLARVQQALASHIGLDLNVHLKIDTGMHRFGVLPEEALSTAAAVAGSNGVRLEGVFTHFATADEDDDSFLRQQQERFEELRDRLGKDGIAIPLVHVSNSAATLRGVAPAPKPGVTRLFRAGLALYGMAPSPDVPLPDSFKPVLTLKTHLGRVFDLPEGEGVSYGLTHVAQETTPCGTVPIGYGDGLNRRLSNRGWMAIGEARCPILGRICMDQTVIELSAVEDAAEGDEVVVIGDHAVEAMTADDAAGIIGTINYEVTTALLLRVARVALRSGQPVAVEDLSGLIER